MNNLAEKRNTERFYLKSPITYSTGKENEARNANMFNCSEGGLYFETALPLKPGVDVVVSGVGQDKFFRASIKWCTRVGPKDKFIYGVGAQYYE